MMTMIAAALLAGTAPAGTDLTLVVRIAELEIDPTQIDAYKAMLAEEVETSVRLESGVLALNAVSLKDRPSSVRLLEVYANQTAYEAHINAPHFLKYKTGTATMIRSLRLVETTPILLCAKTADADHPRCLGRDLETQSKEK